MATKVTKKSDLEIIETIKTDMFEVGQQCVKSFNTKANVVDIRGANMAYRCSLQAIRDKARYHIQK